MLKLFSIFSFLILSIQLSFAQAPFERIPYSKMGDWTVTEYKDNNTKAFLRCSLERHYGNDHNLTIARNLKGFVLGFTSKEWPYTEGIHPITLKIDHQADIHSQVRVRTLPGGNVMGFVDFEADAEIIKALMNNDILNVRSGEMNLDFALNGSMPAINSVKQCYSEKH
ncbi:MAG: hypothetical protein HOH19_15085 [Kordiimonadaceae bacterium]|jgi:hypothetical protein|nr:hypothetical protein [Kordiimonadaceae bacterium]